MSTTVTDSCARGRTDTPLIEQTIGAFFDDMVARFPEREALVVAHQKRRFTYRQLQAESRRLASARWAPCASSRCCRCCATCMGWPAGGWTRTSRHG